MSRFVDLSFRNRRNRILQPLALAAATLLLAATAHAQFGAPPTTRVLDSSALHPPAGARVALVEFEDLSVLTAPAPTHCSRKQPKVSHPVGAPRLSAPYAQLSFNAAVNARWFDTKSKAIGDDYRDYIFANQPSIETPAQLTQITSKYAQAHASPFLSPSTPRANLQAWSRATTRWASASALSTRPPSGSSLPTARARRLSKWWTAAASSSSSTSIGRHPRTLVLHMNVFQTNRAAHPFRSLPGSSCTRLANSPPLPARDPM